MLSVNPSDRLGVVRRSGYDFEMYPTLTVKLSDKLGQAAHIARLLGDQGVNMQFFLPISVASDSCIVAIGVDNFEAATKALGDRLVEYTYS